MSLTLSSDDLEHAARAVQLLSAPLDQPHVDTWRSEVNRCLRGLLHADSAGFILPNVDGPVVYSDEHDPEELARYPDWLPPPLPNGKPVFARVIELGVATLDEAYDGHAGLYLQSAYYNEYAGANGAHDPLLGMISLGGTDPRRLTGLNLWHDSPTGRRFTSRETALLRLVLPALRAGAEMQLRWGKHREDLLSALDGLGQATMVCNTRGRMIHQTPALVSALSADPEGDMLRQAMLEVAAGLCTLASAPLVYTDALFEPAEKNVRTAYAAYRVTGSLYRSPFSSSPALVLLALERTSLVPRTEQDLREAYGLTRAESHVAALLITGKSSPEIAGELHVSPHTVRRHAEQILFKTGARSRSELALKILR